MQYIILDKSDNNNRDYFSHFTKWLVFTESKGLVAVPASSIHIALYITHLLEPSSSYGFISSHKYAIKWTHSFRGLSDPTHPFIKTSGRKSKANINKNEPFIAEHLITRCSL